MTPLHMLAMNEPPWSNALGRPLLHFSIIAWKLLLCLEEALLDNAKDYNDDDVQLLIVFVITDIHHKDMNIARDAELTWKMDSCSQEGYFSSSTQF